MYWDHRSRSGAECLSLKFSPANAPPPPLCLHTGNSGTTSINRIPMLNCEIHYDPVEGASFVSCWNQTFSVTKKESWNDVDRSSYPFPLYHNLSQGTHLNSPVQNCLKFLAILGTISAKNLIFMPPTSWLPMLTSKHDGSYK